MNEFFDRIATEWRDRAPELARWTFQHLVNRTDVWGRYLPKKHRLTADGTRNHAITAPFRAERGKVFLNESYLEKHFKTRQVGGVLGVHSAAADGSTRWMAIDVDLHAEDVADGDDLSVTPRGNYAAVTAWYTQLANLGFDPLLYDSNGQGGFHLVVVFAAPMSSRDAHCFLAALTSDYASRGLDRAPEIFPGKHQRGHYGSWLRLPGRHHTLDHYTRVWNDEPWGDEPWLEGHDAIDRILRTQTAPLELLEQHGIHPVRKTICLDFDGVLHSYVSGWQGATSIPDPPIHRTKEAIDRLRKSFRVVVHSTRTSTDAGCQAIQDWLTRHGIEVDDVCIHKPPAFVYVDDRAIPFTGDWDDAITAINAFRK
ncbi:MAG: hypothetical protein KDA60_14870 [Planctomycetales bacterium]|nr:hypothetical protein [Planctomycetales bacterium]